MTDVIKNVLYAGAGIAAMTTEKIQETVDDLIEKGKISDKEGRKIVNEFWKNTEAKKNEFEKKFNSAAEDVISKFDFLKNKDFETLERRVKSLEVKLGKLSKNMETTDAAPKKTASKVTVK